MILIVGNDAKAARSLRNILEARGFSVMEANNGFSVIRMINSRVPDLIFMDSTMPGIDCVSLTALIRSNPATSKVPVITFTPPGTDGAYRNLKETGCDDFPNMQITEDEIIGILDKFRLTDKPES